ncbi:MAG: GNAT family N-acetyltransferase [Pseudomonadota bacterium]
MFHRSERLLLRPIWPEDWPAIKAGIADLQVLRHLASAPYPYHDKDAQEFTRRPIAPGCVRFLVTRAVDAEVLGTIGIDLSPTGEPELGYWIARAHWGHGYATEAGLGAIKVAQVLGHNRLIASHFVDNPASGKVLRKLGFVATGQVNDRFSLGRGEEAPAADFELALQRDNRAMKCAA